MVGCHLMHESWIRHKGVGTVGQQGARPRNAETAGAKVSFRLRSNLPHKSLALLQQLRWISWTWTCLVIL